MASPTDDWFHVFLCYKSEDYTAAMALRLALVERGLRVFLDVIEGEIWAPLTRSIEEALARSRTLVALMTPNFPVSPHCREELHSALCAAYYMDNGETRRVMAITQGIKADDVRPSQLTAHRLPFSNQPSTELLDRIADNVEAHDGLFGDAPTAVQPEWYPWEGPGDRYFRGRYAELWDIHAGLRAREKSRDRGKPVVVVDGPGGQGKTSLALQYARLFARDHSGGVFVLDFGGSHDADAGGVLARLDEHLAGIAEHLKASDAKDGLAALGRPYLWILDDVPAGTDKKLLERLYAPTSAGHTIVTTRGRFERRASQQFTLGPLGADIGGMVLTAYRAPAREERAAVRATVEMLGEHPLGLTIAAGLTTLSSFAGYPALLEDLSAAELDRLESAQFEADLPTGCDRPFSRVLLRSFDSLGPDGQDVLAAASVLGPATIPDDLLADILRRSDARRDLTAGVAEGAARSLLTKTGTGCSMHALVARAVRVLVHPPDRRSAFRDAALAELTASMERTRMAYRHREVLDRLPHVRAVAGLLAGGDDWVLRMDESHLANEAGRTEIETGRTREALTLFQALHDACVAADVDWYTRTIVLIGLSNAYGLEGEYSKALSLKQDIADLLLAKLGPRAAETLMALNNLGVSHHNLKQYEKAHTLFQQVYQGRLEHREMGPTHRDTLIALNNLAIACGHLGATPEERDLQHRVAHQHWLDALDRWRRVAAPEDQYRLDALNGLALSYRTLGMPQEALKLMTELHQLRLALLGPDHPDTVSALENKLVIAAEANESVDETFALVLLSRLEEQGPYHPDTGVTLHNLMHEDVKDAGRAASVPAELPPGVTAEDGIRLDGDHVDFEVDLLVNAIDLQDSRVGEFGPDDPRTLIASSFLAYALAFADHVDGQLEDAADIARDAYEGLADAVAENDPHVGPHDLRIAEIVRRWVDDRLDQSGG